MHAGMFAAIDASARTVVLVEGVSDQRALETLAARHGHDLASAGVAIVAMGGSKNVRYAVDRFGRAGLDLRLAGLVDAPKKATTGARSSGPDLRSVRRELISSASASSSAKPTSRTS